MTTTDRPRKVNMVEHAASGTLRQWTLGKGQKERENKEKESRKLDETSCFLRQRKQGYEEASE